MSILAGKRRAFPVLLLSFSLSACASPGQQANSVGPEQNWREIYSSVKASWQSDSASIDPDTRRLPTDRLLPSARSNILRIYNRIVDRNGLPRNTAVVVLAGCESMSAASNTVTRTIRICRGLLRVTESDDEVAFVLSHELGHILLGHQSSEHNISDNNVDALFALGQFGALVLGATVPGAGPLVGSLVLMGTLPNARHDVELRLALINRQEETEADRVGLNLMVIAGYNPTAAAKVLDAVSAMIESPVEQANDANEDHAADARDLIYQNYWRQMLEPGKIAGPNEDLRSHPAVAARIQYINEQIATSYPVSMQLPASKLSFLAERDRYLDTVEDIRQGRHVDDELADGNLALFQAWFALHRGQPELALKALASAPEGEAGPDRWARMAVIAGLLLHDQSRAREFADRHYLSGEWRNSAHKPPNVLVTSLWASPEIQKEVTDLVCSNEYRYHHTPLDYVMHVCPGPEDYRKDAESVLRKSISGGWGWQF